MQYRRIIFKADIIFMLAMLVLAACAPKVTPPPAWEKDARALLDQADGLLAKRQFDQAARTTAVFFTRYPKSMYTDRALYITGESRFAQRDYPGALSYYKEIIERFPASSFIIDAKYKLGLCYFETKDYDLAIANLEDRSKITDPAKLRRISETLSASYMIKKNYLKAIREYVYLAANAPEDRQRAGYRDRIHEIIEKNLTADELKTLSQGTAYPADVALLRLSALYVEQRQYHEAVDASKEFLSRFPNHPEKTRAEMLLAEATTGLSAPRYALAALVPQSGQLAFFGDSVLKGVQLAVHDYNVQQSDNRVELIVKDTEGSPEKTVAVMNEVASKGVIAAVGPLLTKEVEALVPVLDKLHVPVITPAASGEDVGKLSPWIFRNALTNSSQALVAAQYALGQKLRRIVIFYPDDPYGEDLSRLFAAELERKAEIFANISYPPDTNDFGPYIRTLIEIDLRSRKIRIPDDEGQRKKLFQSYVPSFNALYMPGYADKVGLLIPQLAFYNISGLSMIGSNSWHSQDLMDRAGRYAEGAVFTDGFAPESQDPIVKNFVDSYRSAYQEEPDILAAQAYDAAAMILSLVREHKDTPQAVRDGLLALKDFHGVSGITTFPGNGEAQKKIFLIKIQDGKFVPVNSN